MTSQLLATLHPRSKPSKPKICLKMPSRTPQEGPRRAQDSPRWAQDGPEKGRRTKIKSRKIFLELSWVHRTSMLAHLRAILAHFGLYLALSSPSLSQHGLQVALFKPSRPQQDLQTTTLQAFSRLLALRSRPKNIDFPMVFKGFCNPTSQPHLMPTTALLNPRFAARCPLGPPRKGQGRPKTAQDGPKMGPTRCPRSPGRP